MSITEAQARRAVRRAEVDWDEAVEDGRSDRNQRHEHHGLLSLLVAGFACGRSVLRRVEELCDDVGVHARRRLGIPRAVSDSTLFRLLGVQSVAGLRETVRAQVKRMMEKKLVGRELFRLGVVSFDGKTVWSSTSKKLEGAKESVDSKKGIVTSSLTTLRAVLTSARARPCLDLELIAAKTGESPAFRAVFPRVVESFGSLFSVVTTDAGMTARENALVIRGAGKHYLLALKGNQPKLAALAEKAFALLYGTYLLRAEEHCHGGTMTRELLVVSAAGVEGFDFHGAEEVWQVTQRWEHPDGRRTEEVRHFISSMPAEMLSTSEKLALVRLHWGIENGLHWTLDMVLSEDDSQPVQTSRAAIEVVAWLRVLAYNLLSVWRAGAAQKDGRPLSWGRSMELLRDALVLARPEALPAHRA